MSEFDLQHIETPVIVIERDEEPVETVENNGQQKVSRLTTWLRRLFGLVCVSAVVLATACGFWIWRYYHHIGVPVSTSPAQNIEKLKAPLKSEAAEVVLTSDSILGVALDFYAIHGLHATIEMVEPDTADASVFLYCRSADHTPDHKYLGSLVIEGKELQSDRSRLGYMGMADGRMVIGISRSDKVKDYVRERGGSFFRQFILVSDGVIPARYYLRGKVERRAIGRMDDTLYYIATRNKETMYDFADALSEYGFTDAIYITGGADYCFYRTRDSQRHDIGNVDEYPHLKWVGDVPWLVFRK